MSVFSLMGVRVIGKLGASCTGGRKLGNEKIRELGNERIRKWVVIKKGF